MTSPLVPIDDLRALVLNQYLANLEQHDAASLRLDCKNLTEKLVRQMGRGELEEWLAMINQGERE